MKTKILKVKGDWIDVVDDCRASIGKELLGKEPTIKFKKQMLISEHSPIRNITIKWRWDAIKSWVATHFVRNIWYKVVQTQREDRTGIGRDKSPQDTLVIFTGEANPQHLIDTSRKRLCYKAAKETREHMEDLKVAIHEFQPEIANVCVPNCIYRMSCPEPEPCGFFDEFVKIHGIVLPIQERYDAFNIDYYERKAKETNDL